MRKQFIEDSVRHVYRRARRKELLTAKRGGGYTTSASGSKHEKGDVKKFNGKFRIENKTTTKESFRVTKSMLDKLEEAALLADETPCIIIEFLGENGLVQKEFAVVPVYALDG